MLHWIRSLTGHFYWRTWSALLCLFTFGLLTQHGQAEFPTLVRDVDPSPLPIALFSSLRTRAGSFSYFLGDDGEHGGELWRTDGTAAGTRMVQDLFPGETGSNPNSFFPVGSTLLFLANEPTLGRSLYRTDGNTIVRVKSITVNPNLGFQFALGITNGLLILVGNDGVIGSELWRSDGTESGTFVLKDFNPFPNAGSSFLTLGETNGKVTFVAFTSAEGFEPWVTDGTEAGTTILKDIAPGFGSSDASPIGGEGPFLYFSANDGTTGNELYRTDGTPGGTIFLKDFEPGTTDSSFTSVGMVGSMFLFSARVGEERELWRSSGNPGDTVLVKDIEPGPGSSDPGSGVSFGNRIIFAAKTSATGGELFESNGTAAGTKLFVDLRPGPESGVPFLLASERFGTRFLFRADDGVAGTELWSSDGTVGGTALIKDIFLGAGSSNIFSFGTSPSEGLFFAQDNFLNTALYRSNGTVGGTIKVTDLDRTDITQNSAPDRFIAVGQRSCWLGSTPGFSRDVLCSDGSQAGTSIVSRIDIFGGFAALPGSSTKAVAALNESEVIGRELHLLDTAPGVASLIKEIRPGSDGVSIFNFVESGGKLFFLADDAPGNTELWVTDGTAAGTIKLTEHVSPTTSALRINAPLIPFKGGVLFATSASSVTADVEPWFSDGTVSGTIRIKDLNPTGVLQGSSVSTNGFAPVVVGNLAFFSGFLGTGSTELIQSDGTEAGTVALTNLSALNLINNIGQVGGIIDGRVYFSCSRQVNSSGANELCRTASNPDGLEIFKEFVPGPLDGGRPSDFASFGGRLFFTAETNDFGREAWVTDGTEAGTFQLKDIVPGAGNGAAGNQSQSGFPIVADGFVFFLGTDEEHGRQIWRTDGTSAGTVELLSTDPASQTDRFRPSGARLVGSDIYVHAFSEAFGSEAFVIKDQCPGIAAFTPTVCGCGAQVADVNANGIADCLKAPELKARLLTLKALVQKIRGASSAKAKRKARSLKRQILAAVADVQSFVSQNRGELDTQDVTIAVQANAAAKLIPRSLRLGLTVKRDKRRALAALQALIDSLPSA